MDSRARTTDHDTRASVPDPRTRIRHGDAMPRPREHGFFFLGPCDGRYTGSRRWEHGREASPSGPQSNTRQPPLKHEADAGSPP
jgi:hypothetical protein